MIIYWSSVCVEMLSSSKGDSSSFSKEILNLEIFFFGKQIVFFLFKKKMRTIDLQKYPIFINFPNQKELFNH